MPGGFYDSPTFLSRKDVYLAGLTLPQLMGCMVIAVFAFIISLMLPFGIVGRLAVTLPLTVLGSFFAFGRVYGLSVPAFLLSALTFPLRSPVYEDELDSILHGDPLWLQRQTQRQAQRDDEFSETPEGNEPSRGVFARLTGAKDSIDPIELEARKVEAKAEVSAKVDEGARTLERFLRDGIKAMFRKS